jgi:tetratricopeptide (TPR) repeat protein
MTEAALKGQAPSHAAFLERLAEASSPLSSDARLGHAAFLTLRLVDLLQVEREALPAAAFHYQHTATELSCRDLPRDSTETAHISGLLRAAADAYRSQDVQLVVPALLAYAHYLEDELRLGEALDVLETVLRVGGTALLSADQVAARLRLARVLRKLNEFDAAEEAYAAAGALAEASGDRHSELLSRIGRANTVLSRGNLAEAELLLRAVLLDSEMMADRDARARAHQGLDVALITRGQPAEAIPSMWRAFELYEDDSSRTRALGDLGGMLLMVGDPEAAELALVQAVRSDMHDVVNNAMIELMHCASYRRDRLAFERWRAQCELSRDAMPPSMLADFYYKSGIGRARFGQVDRADLLLNSALKIAEETGLHELAFRIDRVRIGLRDCRPACETPSATTAEPELQSRDVREVSVALAHLGARNRSLLDLTQ